ncbi:MAG: sugar phosphate nucleotidyltransferase [Candidatus Zipacnadales bacterium]
MEVVIFVGGRGTRMNSHEQPLPKVLYELGGQPILWHVIQLYQAAGHNEIILPLGYRGTAIARYFLERLPQLDTDFVLHMDGQQRHTEYLSGEPGRVSIKFVRTGIDTGKGERLRRVAPHIKGDTFFATYGDGLADIDLNALAAFHHQHGKVATITVVRARSQFGHVELDEAGIVAHVEEKPLLPGWVNGGFFVFSRRIFEYLQPEDELEPDCFPRLVADRELAAYRHEGFWACMDTDKDYFTLDRMCQSGAPPWQTW